MTETEKRLAWLLPSVPVLLFVLIFWETLLFMPKILNAGDGDLGRHITIGNSILTTGQIPTQDVFSHTMTGAPLVPHEWLSQTLFALAHRAAGLDGVAWLTAFVLASTYAILAIGLRRIGVRAVVALAGAFIASVVGAVHVLARPHIFSLLFFTCFLVILEDYRHTGRRRALWLLPLLMVAWANTHGAFISGIVLVLLYGVGTFLGRERQRLIELAGLEVALLLATLINPVGWLMIGNSFAYLQNRFLVDVTVEYTSPNFHLISAWPFAALLLLSLAIAWRTNRRLGWTPLILVGGWSAFALYSARNIPLYAQVAVIALAPAAESLIDEMLPAAQRVLSRTDELDRASWGWVWAVVVVAALIGAQASGTKVDAWGMGNAFDPRVFPVAAVDALKDSPPAGNMFNDFNWGGYLLYRLWPQKQVFIDGQTDFYGEALTREYLQVANVEPGWEAVLDRYKVRWVIVPPSRALAARLDASSDWARQYKDETAGVWVRR